MATAKKRVVKRVTTRKPAKLKKKTAIGGIYQDYVYRNPRVVALTDKIEDLKDQKRDLIASLKEKYKKIPEKTKQTARKAY